MQQRGEYRNDLECQLLPEINAEETKENKSSNSNEVIGDSPYPCCRYITIPNKGYALAYICPVCCWENDLFITDDNEVSDLNNGLALKEARYNYKVFGASQKRLKLNKYKLREFWEGENV